MASASAKRRVEPVRGEDASSSGSGSGGRFRPQNNRYLDEARALHALLSDGASGLGYHVKRGLAVRDAVSKRPLPSSYTLGWRPARERHEDFTETDRVLNPYVLQKHLLGNYDVAWETPSWTSLVVLDIDRPNVVYEPGETEDPERELRANYKRDDMLAAVWDAFGFDKEKLPVVLSTPGGGYHVYLPLLRSADGDARERTWPAAWVREHIEHHLNQHGLELKPGSLELFPSGIRLRAPCGAGMALLQAKQPDFSDDLKLEPLFASWKNRRDRRTGERRPTLIRQIGPMVGAFLEQIEASRRPLEAWLDSPGSGWHDRWGPWGKRGGGKNSRTTSKGLVTQSRHKEEVNRGVGRQALSSLGSVSMPQAAGWLLYGEAFRERIRDLTKVGLEETGQRHDAALKLCWHWGRARGHDKEETLERVHEWLVGFAHESATWKRSPEKFVRETMREVSHYFDRHVAPAALGVRKRGVDVALRPLTQEETDKVLPKVDECCRKEAGLILQLLRGEADTKGRVPHAVNLSGQIVATLCGERRVRVEGEDGQWLRRRATVMAMEELLRLGILAMHTNYSVGRHGRLYTCWYQFGSGVLPSESAEGELVLASRKIEEGDLQARSDGDGDAWVMLTPTDVRLPPEHVVGTGEAPPKDEDAPWWVRMYERRAFTPAEFFEGDERRVIPGPFRHRYPDKKERGVVTGPPRAAHTPPPEGSPTPSPIASTLVAGCGPLEFSSDQVVPVSQLPATTIPLSPPSPSISPAGSATEPATHRQKRRAIDAWSEPGIAAHELAAILADSPTQPANAQASAESSGLRVAIAKAWEAWTRQKP